MSENIEPVHSKMMESKADMPAAVAPGAECMYCGSVEKGKYCSQCGKKLKPGRITLGAVFHDVFHLFTKIDKGFLFTLITLFRRPGHLQWDYINGARERYQKPFSMLFICGTIAALIRYIVYKNTDGVAYTNVSEAAFFREYWVLLHMLLLPLYALTTYAFFYRTKYNYAEISVLIMYVLSAIFILSGLTSFFRLLDNSLDTIIIELPFSILYIPITYLNFFKENKRGITILKSLGVLAILYMLAQLAEDFTFNLLN